MLILCMQSLVPLCPFELKIVFGSRKTGLNWSRLTSVFSMVGYKVYFLIPMVSKLFVTF